MKKILNRIWLEITRILYSTWWVWVSAILAVVAGFIFGGDVAIWVFFGGVISVIVYVWGRSIWWFVSGTGDFKGREGVLKKLWNKVFKK